MPLTRHLQASRFKSTAAANDILTSLSAASGWPDHVLSRLAISRSLQDPKPPDLIAGERRGKQLRGETFFRATQDPDYLPWAVAMITQHLRRPFKNDDEAEGLLDAHWHRGLTLLERDMESHSGDFNETLLSLIREASDRLPASTGGASRAGRAPVDLSGDIRPITVAVGRTSPDSDPSSITLNDTRRFSNSHMAVSGMSGSGKTQLVKQMLASAAEVCDTNTGIIFIDYAKGDVADDEAFVRSIGAEVIGLPGDVLPIGPFHLPEYTDDAVRLAAEEKREVYAQLFRNLGPKQEGRLVQAIRASYASLRNDPEPVPDFAYTRHMLEQIYQNDGLQPDSLTELFRRLTSYRLFWSRESAESPVAPIHTQRWVVDVHELGGLKEVTAFTLIEQLYREMRSLPESAVDPATGLRQIRCILVVDEAQYYLRAKNRFLQGIIREGRSKGFSVMLMCQSPDDFEQSDFDYTEQLQFTFMLQCKTAPKAVQRLLGVNRDEAKRIAADLGRMEPLHGVGRLLGESTSEIKQFRIVPFFERSDTMS